ncbi:MAG: flagellar biosynthesis protein FlgN [Spirochaetales bacterium]|nr:flagellar biosynthesis protein FlgN [Spirochaetales bacterium]
MESRLDRRIQILRRLRRYLEEQRDRFVSYLRLLELQGSAIRSGDVERIRDHVELEQEIIGDITALQRAIDPLEELYRRGCPQPGQPILTLRSGLDSLRARALARNRENRRLLGERLETLRLEIKEVGRRARAPASPFTLIGVPSLVDVRS